MKLSILTCFLLHSTFVLVNGNIFAVNTQDEYKYHVWNENFKGKNEICVTFTVQANNDAHIGFFDNYAAAYEAPGYNQALLPPMYEVVLGGWADTQSVIRETAQGANYGVKSGGWLDAAQPHQFWVNLNKNSKEISLGQGSVGGQEKITSAILTTEHQTGYVGFSTGWGSTGQWTDIQECHTNNYQAGSAKQEPGIMSNVGVSGDPHFKTWTGDKYDYHGICDLVLLSHPGFLEGVGMQINVRSQKTKRWSYISTAVVHIGTGTFEVAGIKGGNTSWLNSIEVSNNKWEQDMVAINGYPIKYERLHTESRGYVIDLGNNESIQIKTWKNMVRVNVIDNPEKQRRRQQQGTFDGSLGLMGSYPKGIMLGRDGETEITEIDNFGQEWQVLSSEPMVFHNTDGPQHPSKCEQPSKQELRRRLSKSNVSRQDAENACARIGVAEDEFDLCIFDVMAIGDASAAGAY